MVNEEIFEGLKLALSKGESLKQAMMSFYNAGYKKEEIEEAARALQGQRIEKEPIQTVQQAKPKKQKEIKTPQKVSGYGTPEQIEIQPSPKIKQGIDAAIKQLKKIKVHTVPKTIRQKPVKTVSPKRVSSYEKKPKPRGKLITLLLIFFLLFLVGVLAAIFLFREELVEAFNSLF